MLAYIFSGQGSQKKGMGSDLFDEFPKLIQIADEILGYSIKQLCLEDPDQRLNLTQFTQPALYCVNSLSYLKKIKESGFNPDFVAGHSLGEFVALFAAGAYDFETGLKLVKKRGELMGNIFGGGMAAVIGLKEESVKEVLEINKLYGIDIANYNTPSQIVISATKKDIDNAKPIFEAAGALKYTILKVSGAFHSRYMESAKEEFEKYLHTVTFNTPEIPVISNFYARPYEDTDIKTTLANQITGSVKWTESIRYLLGQGVENIIQIGPGNVLSGLVNAIKSGSEPLNLNKNNKKKVERSNEEDIAIIGLSGRYPMANNLVNFWENLKSGKDCITEIPEDRWNTNLYFDADKYNKNTYYNKWGGFLDNIDKFDPTFFNISPKEAEVIDPQERLFLETVWHTIEDAGYKSDTLSGSDMGVFVGVMFGQYQLFGAEELMKGNYRFSETSFASIANRVSFFFNLHGPSIAIDTMCSSSLVTVHMACESIRSGECDWAIAGGVNLSLHPIKYFMLSQKRFASSDGRCRTFGELGDGYVPGEGVGAILLKPLKKAVQDKDNIYAVIKGSAINHGGKTNGYTVPNPIAQSEVILKALRKANINPRTISYVEAHGTGTALGDPIEINGLNMAYKNYTNDKQYCSIGSVKTNIGHLESAAGIASLTKVLLQMKNKQLVPSLHSDELNSLIEFKDSPFRVQHELENWECPVVKEDGTEKIYPRRAGISAFGAGGVNTHFILEEYENNQVACNSQEKDKHIFILSAKKQHVLKQYAMEFVSVLGGHIRNNKDISLRDIAYTLQIGRTEMEERIAFIATNINEIIEKLLLYTEGRMSLEDFYQGNAMSGGQNSDAEQAKGNIVSIQYYDDPNRLAQLWVSGVCIDWNLLYGENRPNRITLPNYPFMKESYWIEQQNGLFQNIKEVLEQVKKVLEQVEAVIEPKKSINISKPDQLKIESNIFGNEAKTKIKTEQNILIRLYDSPEYERNGIVTKHIQKMAADFLSYIPPNLPEIYLDFFDIGMDSVTVLDFKSKLLEEFNIDFPSTVLYEYSTIEKLSEYILDTIQLDEKHTCGVKTSEEYSSKEVSNDKVMELLDKIILSGKEVYGKNDFIEDDLISIIDKMGL